MQLRPVWCANLKALFVKIPPAVTALLLQLFALLLVFICIRIVNFSPDLLTFAFHTGLLSAVLSQLAGLARWWLLIQLLFAPALVLMLKYELPSGLYLAVFLVMLVVYWSTFRSQVPLYLSSKRVWITLEELLPAVEENKKFSFMDIGSGMGGVLTHLAVARPDGLFYGIENAPLPYLYSRLRIALGKHENCQVNWGSLWSCDLAAYDVVFAYLSPVPMEQLWQKIKQEMHPGSIFVSNSFAVPEYPPQYSITLDDLHHSTLFIWEMKK